MANTKQIKAPREGIYIGPAALKVDGMQDMHREIFGPVLHIATFKAQEVDQIISDINQSGYGLTFGLHTRIDDRVEHVTTNLNVGNIYVNRNQIGAIVGSQPFGGEGLSGTGPKAGGPHYVPRFMRSGKSHTVRVAVSGDPVSIALAQEALDALPSLSRAPLRTIDLPGPTGESNRLSIHPRGTILCLGPTPEEAEEQALIARVQGCNTLIICNGVRGSGCLSGHLDRQYLSHLTGIDAVVLWSDEADLRTARLALAKRDGPLIPLIAEHDMADRCITERHVCIDTTASGGNASLLAVNE